MSYVQVLTIVVLLLSLGALAFSLVALFRVKVGSKVELNGGFSHPRTSSIAMRGINRDDFLLSLIAAHDVRVKEVLAASSQNEVFIGIQASGPPENELRGLVSTGAGGEKVSIDLVENPKLRPLFETLVHPTSSSIPTEVSVA